MKTFPICFLLLFSVSILAAQSDFSRHQVGISYLGETYLRPGFSVQYEYSLFQMERLKQRRGKERAAVYSLLWSTKIGGYHHPRNHNGFLLTSGLLLQRAKRSGWQFGMGIFNGYHLSVLNEDTYRVNADGTIVEVKNSNESAYLAGFGGRLGKAFKLKGNRFSWFFSNQALWRLKAQHPSQLTSITELGLFYRF